MNIRHLEFFCHLAKTQHMSQTAAYFGISQPTLSYAISTLEKELGVPLFEKSGRNIKLTHLGKIYLQFIESGLDKIKRGDLLLKRLLNVETGTINLGFTYTLGQSLVPKIINHFLSPSENQQLKFNFSQGNTEQLLTKLLDEKCDLALASFADQIGQTSTKDLLTFYPLVKQEIVAAVPVNHPLALKNSVSLREITDYPLIYFSKDSGLRPIIDKFFKKDNLKPNIKFELEEDQTIAGFVSQELGIALLPNLPLLNQNSIKLLHISQPIIYHQLYLVLKNNYFQTPAVSKFQNFIVNYCQTNFNQLNRLI
ncbi:MULTISPECIES: LysR family transcriptional regulator [Liquorilactobacillus]|jgi:DNA-binding transcriptional LysR family regulator|uniref:LysR family transcriptional regulator n=2 Tax=Liquorilactobacillus nagelii TaxID=82688 RepID=A0A3Q8CZB1_9LACO|nr:LysR family transcriptional regulator [Liquorilactobacillus nagelii]AUJ32021.1 LysR family transcriptional regulator [Liquorilactobacillus nagelii]MCC7615168.1 LysR family transcriptional regulator [Liquorilactobacillus nagelii]MCP9314832.1 LysR family transcriptional regulator [Liquorilactobacillus nagelii]